MYSWPSYSTVWHNTIQCGVDKYGILSPLHWRHNERHNVSTHRQVDCLLNRLIRLTSKDLKWNIRANVTGLLWGNPPVTGGFPSQRASNAETVFIWWRHHDILNSRRLLFVSVSYFCEYFNENDCITDRLELFVLCAPDRHLQDSYSLHDIIMFMFIDQHQSARITPNICITTIVQISLAWYLLVPDFMMYQ